MGTATFTPLASPQYPALPRNLRFEGPECSAIVGALAMSNSYATNGDTLDLSAYFSSVVAMLPALGADVTLTYVAGTTMANGKVKSVVTHTGSQTANTTDLSANSAVPCVIYGVPNPAGI